MAVKKKFCRMLGAGVGVASWAFLCRRPAMGSFDCTGNRTALEHRLEYTRTNAGPLELLPWSFETTGTSFVVRPILTLEVFWRQL